MDYKKYNICEVDYENTNCSVSIPLLCFNEFWQLDGAYQALKNSGKTGDWLPQSNYPMKVEANQVYVIDYTKTDNSKMRLYYISEGKMQNGQLITENIAME